MAKTQASDTFTRGAMSEVIQTFVCVGAMLAVAAIAVPMLAFLPVDGRPVAVVFPPWVGTDGAAQAVWDAGGFVLDLTGISVIAIGDQPDFVVQLRAAGAIVVIDAQNAGSLCVQPLPQDWDLPDQLARRTTQ